MTDLEVYVNKLPDGWIGITGRWLKEMVRIITRDRARLPINSGTEDPTADGRFFNINATQTDGGGGDLVDFDFAIEGGRFARYSVPATFVEYTDE